MDVDARLRGWAERVLGPTRAWVRLDAGQGSTRVFATTDADGRPWIVKQLRSGRGFGQERRAMEEWLSGRTRLGGARVPCLRACSVELGALIVERLAGERVADDGGDADVQRAAGRFLSALHALEIVDDDPLSLGEALERRTDAWLARAELEPQLAAFVRAHGPTAELFAGARRVACHRDFAPRNWLWDEHGSSLAVIDFEHARPDIALGDLVKLRVDVWTDDPSRESAFFAGYGRALDEREHEQLRALVVLHGLASLVWGRERGVPDHVAEGQRALGAVWTTTRLRESL